MRNDWSPLSDETTHNQEWDQVQLLHVFQINSNYFNRKQVLNWMLSNVISSNPNSV